MLDAVVLNRMVLARIRDLAQQKPKEDLHERLQRSLGLFPMPPRTELSASSLAPVEVSGVSVERHVIESRPGIAVPILVYRGGSSLILNLGEVLPSGKAHPAMQAFGISMAKQGFTVISIEPPGKWLATVSTERDQTGDAWEPSLRMGLPAIGQYVWDAMRVLDWALASTPDAPVGVNGLGLGGETAALLFALDERVKACAIACAAGSLETVPYPSTAWCQAAGIAYVGDYSDVLAMRGGLPILLMGTTDDPVNSPDSLKKTADKTKRGFRQSKPRVEIFLGPVDYNRRMRETAAAFFSEALNGARPADYAYEPLPLTDGLVRTAPAGTVDPGELDVLGDALQSNAAYGGANVESFTGILAKVLAEPYPTAGPELTPWGKYGRVEGPKQAETYTLTDGAGAAGTLSMPFKELDSAMLCALGLSPAEFLAEVLHLMLPGSPDGWESVAVGGDALTAMIASMRTLVGKGDPEIVTREITADGPGASLVAASLARLRPGLQVAASHSFADWMDAAAGAPLAGLQPGARYRSWPATS